MIKKVFKKLKLPIIVIISICAVYIIASVAFAYYASENDSITYLGERYTKTNITSVDFIPFGEYNSSFDNETDYINLFGLSFEKKNKDRNFVCIRGVLGNKLFKKDSYDPPIDPQSENVDKIIIFDNSTDQEAIITDRKDINTLVSYFSSINGEVAVVENEEQDVYVYAVSYKDGGVFNLTGNDRGPIRNEKSELYIEDMLRDVYLPKDVTSIIDNSLTKTNKNAL